MISQYLNKVSDLSLPSFDFTSPIGKLSLLLLSIIILSFVINFLLSNTILGVGYRIFVAPGIILHELAHALLCFFTGAKITKISFFDKKGGEVKHGPSKIPVIGQFLISMAPFFFGAAAIYFISEKMGIKGVDLDNIKLTKEGISASIIYLYRSIDYRNIFTFASLYLVTSIAVTMTPSLQDLRNIMLSVIVLAIASYFIIHDRIIVLDSIAIPDLYFSFFSTVLILLIFALIPSIILFILSKALKPNG